MGRPVPWALGLLLSLLIGAEAGRNFRLLRQQVLRAREVQAMKETVSRRWLLRPVPWRAPSEGALRQPLDHFDRQEGQGFNQRFWINEEFWHRPAGPVFLYIGGESSLSQFAVLAGHHMELAQKYGALAVALEHRFYGASINPDGLQDASLRFLSSQQAFPHLVFAAVASSAPVRAQLDFTGYNQVVAASLLDPVVGGSAQCREAVAKAFSAVDQRLHAGRLAELEKDFRSCGPLTEPDDRGELASNLADIFMGAVQYNDEGFQGGTVAKLCSIMNDTGLGSPYQRLITVNNGFLESMALPCVENSRQRTLAELRSANLTLSGVGERQWYFQTCTEFGYYQTCEDVTCPFSQLLTLSAQLDVCSQVFGISPEHVREAVTFTNEYYGADHPKASRILFVNGDIDPWHALSVLKNQSRSELAILINGTSHCANMNPSRPSDPLPLVSARQRIDYHIGDWLSLARKAPSAL
nr:thymus-specific serine protease [Chelonoidis abingdonii]